MVWLRRERELWGQHLLIKSLYGRSEDKKNSKREVKTAKKTASIPKMHKQARLTAFI